MKEIKCPKCGEVFQVDESGYIQIVKQIRDEEFENELERRAMSIKTMADMEREQAVLKALQKKSDESNAAIKEKEEELSRKLQEIERLTSKLDNAETEKKLAVEMALKKVNEEISGKDNEITELKGRLTNKDAERKISKKT